MNKELEKNKGLFLSAIFVAVVIFSFVLIYWFNQDKKIDEENRNIEFIGIVIDIRYDVKQFPTIRVDNKEYYIGAGYDTGHQIEIGDFVIKRRGSDMYKLIKQKDHRILMFTK